MKTLQERAIALSAKIREEKSNIHGTIFERFIINYFGLHGTSESTSFWDAHTKKENGVAISIKTAERKYGKRKDKDGNLSLVGDIMLADFFSQFKEVNEDFYFIVGEWEGHYLNIVSVKVYYINHKVWKKFFSERMMNKYKFFLESRIKNCKDIPHERDIWKAESSQLKKEWELNTLNIVRPRPKNDCYLNNLNEKTGENRIQCAITRAGLHKYFGKTVKEKKVWTDEVYLNFAINDYHNQKKKEEKFKKSKKSNKSSGLSPYERALQWAERDSRERERAMKLEQEAKMIALEKMRKIEEERRKLFIEYMKEESIYGLL